MHDKISVITVVFNGIKSIETTMLSVLNQSYDNTEYIIIDGGSTDGTVDVIEKYSNKIDYWVSESDHGIYDAMNKGIDTATGDWIMFMNCGDRFYSNETLSNVFKSSSYDSDILYGDAIVEYPTFKKRYDVTPLDQMWKKMPFCHQACFVKSNFMKSSKFDLRYKLSSDYNFLYNAFVDDKSFRKLNTVICFFDFKEGASKQNALRSIKERKDIVLKQNYSTYKSISYDYFILQIKVTLLVKKVIGEKLTDVITKILKKV